MRIKNLDFLRAVAIIGVLFQHSSWVNRVTQSGWMGVDLFFVLSGFLVSNLLFSEIKNTNAVNSKLFLIRRGFKIYPAFYFFFVVTLLYKFFVYHDVPPTNKILAEIFFLQSYLPDIWLHTWSLAIEEHFYIFIAILIWVLVKTKFIFKKNQVLSLFIFLWLLVIGMRFTYCIQHINDERIYFFQSHLRSDGLFLGCLLSYCFSFFESFKNFFSRNSRPLLIISLALLFPPFFWKTGSFNMDSYGITSIEISFAILVGIASLNIDFIFSKYLRPVFNTFCMIGVYSYSIYLWHAFVMDECDLHVSNKFYHTIIYIPSSIILGIIFSKLIEMPVLRVRERFFKSEG